MEDDGGKEARVAPLSSVWSEWHHPEMRPADETGFLVDKDPGLHTATETLPANRTSRAWDSLVGCLFFSVSLFSVSGSQGRRWDRHSYVETEHSLDVAVYFPTWPGGKADGPLEAF